MLPPSVETLAVYVLELSLVSPKMNCPYSSPHQRFGRIFCLLLQEYIQEWEIFTSLQN